MTTAQVFDNRCCTLGEGPLWHPERRQLFWFDILGKRLLTRDDDGPRHWQFGEHVSAAGWIDRDTLLIASETALFRFDIETGAREDLVALEADNPATRSNDGRADPLGGFWISTMGKTAEPGAGAIYRFFEGALHQLHADLTIPNAICFSPDGRFAYFVDTVQRRIQRQRLDGAGWPAEAPEVFVDLTRERLNPDGAVVDAEGCLWNAQWGAGRVARYAPDGRFLSALAFPATHVSCPAFGGRSLTTLFATSATEGIDAPADGDGLTYSVETGIIGQAEHQVKV
jgi:sugar lactone lactonase YvrE